MLVQAGHPAGRVLASARGTGRHREAPGLWRSELELDRLFASRVSRASRRAGAPVRRFTALLIDVQNAWSVLSASGWGEGVSPDDVFLEGGQAIDRDAFRTLATLPDSGDARWVGLTRHFAATPLGRLFAERPSAAVLEDRLAAALVAWQRAEARTNPLSAAAVLEVLLRIRAEAHDVRLVAFGVDLGAPRQAIEPNLVSAA
jgi:vacuolar-type H+-ATPase subunit C/Vma6